VKITISKSRWYIVSKKKVVSTKQVTTTCHGKKTIEIITLGVILTEEKGENIYFQMHSMEV
jgi:hypothetical protein